MHSSPAVRNSLMWITERPDVVFVHGNGSWLFDRAGKRYLDFMQGWAVNALGHSHPAIVTALTRQAGQLINSSPAYYNEPSLALAKILTDHSVFDRVFFANSGAEANEGAIKLARKWGQLHKNGAFEVITFDNGFHGRTLATMSASGKPGWDVKFAPQVAGFPKAELNDLESVEALIGRNTVAIMVEPIQGEAGVIPATPEFLCGLRDLADRHRLLLIVDEVQTGVGRTGKLFAYEHAGITPDIMTLGKGLGGGVPLAALLAREQCCCFVAGDQGGTFCGNPLTTAVGVAVLNEILAPGFLASVADNAAYMMTRFEELAVTYDLGEVRGTGLLQALVLADDRAPNLVARALHREPDGLLLNAPRPNVLRFMPALNVTVDEIDLMVAGLEELLCD